MLSHFALPKARSYFRASTLRSPAQARASLRSPAQARASTLALVLLLSACGDDSPAPAGTPANDAALPLPNDAAQTAAPVATGPVLEAGAQQPGAVLTPDAGSSGPTLIAPDAGAVRDAGPIVITIPTRSVVCGSSECTTTNNRTCCLGWSKDMGFMGAPTCTTNATCTSDHVMFGDTNRAVVNDCDEPSDCSGGQICCFVRYGAPVTADLFSADIVGPGASRLCTELSACNAGMTQISGVAGIPVGIQACKTAADCKDGTQCVPETNDSTTTGKGGSARPGVMVCK
jgi:hypothetical protein